MKTLYININNEQIQSNEELEVLNYDLDSDFFFYLGEKIAKGCKIENENALLTDFNTKENEEDYKQIIVQWNEIKGILFSEKCEGEFKFTLPNGYIHWLCYSEKYNHVYDKNFSHGEPLVIYIDLKELYEESVEDMQRKILRKLQRDDLYREIDEIIFNDDAVTCKSPIIRAIKDKYDGIGFKAYKKWLQGDEKPHTPPQVCEKCGKNPCECNAYEHLIEILLEHRYIDFREGLSMIEKNNKWGFIDISGKTVISCQYDAVGDFHNGCASVRLNDKWGYIDKTGKPIIPCMYDEPLYFEEGLSSVRCNQKTGFIDINGKNVIPCIYDEAGIFSHGMAAVELNGKLGYVDRNGKLVIPCVYDTEYGLKGNQCHDFLNSFCPVYSNGKWGVIDKNGKLRVPCIYDGVWGIDDSNEDCVVELNHKVGYIDINNKSILPIIYDKIWKFHDGIAPAKLNGECIYINKQGEQVIPFSYEDNYYFENGLARVKLNGKYGYIDSRGNQVIPCAYDRVDMYFDNGLSKVRLNNRFGYIDITGKHIIPIMYTWVRQYDEINLIEAFDNESKQLCYYDCTGNLIKKIACDDYICEKVYY